MAVITARYPGKCGACGADITPGEQINYVKGGGASCTTCPEQKPTTRPDGRSGNRTRRRGGGYGRGYSSNRYIRPSNQRCEDAPCCGCCDVC